MPDGERGIFSQTTPIGSSSSLRCPRRQTALIRGFLQSYDQELGSKSYGAVVDLLVAYYGGV